MPLLARVSAVAHPVSVCALSDVRSLCAPPPLRGVRLGTRPSPPVSGPSLNVPLPSCADLLRSQQTPAQPIVKERQRVLSLVRRSVSKLEGFCFVYRWYALRSLSSLGISGSTLSLARTWDIRQ